MAKTNEEAKEIRLFGEKSVREEAYRKKILQLEKEMARLEILAKSSHHSIAQKKEAHSVHNGTLLSNHGMPPPHLEGLYHDSLIAFNKKLKREQEFLERRASEIVERLNLQAQHLTSSIELSYRHKLKWLTLSGLTVIGLFILLFIVIFFPSRINLPRAYNISVSRNRAQLSQAEIFHRRLSYLKTALQTQTVYRNQYEVNYLDLLNGIYAVEIELNSSPADRWSLKNISSEIIAVFQKYNSGTPAEFSFLHKGKLYIKAYLSGPPQKIRFQYFF